MQELPAGPDAVLLDFADADDPARAVLESAIALRAAIADGRLVATEDVVPSASSILVQGKTSGGVDVLGIHRALRFATTGADVADSTPSPVEIPVHYNGDDLDAVAGALDVSVDAVIAAHRGTEWVVQFMGFAPGFGYLVPASDAADTALAGLLNLPRRPHARTRVPAGSVAIAAGYSAVYPRDSPGGWNLLGRTRISLWSEHDDPPAFLAPGTRVRFVDASVSQDSAARPDDDTENQ